MKKVAKEIVWQRIADRNNACLLVGDVFNISFLCVLEHTGATQQAQNRLPFEF